MSSHHQQDQQNQQDQRIASHMSPTYGLGLQELPINHTLSATQYGTEFEANEYSQSLSGFAYGSPNLVNQDINHTLPPPQAAGFSPRTGSTGNRVAIRIRCHHPFLAMEGLTLAVLFRDIGCPISVQPLPPTVDQYEYVIHFRVPYMTDINSEHSVDCPLQLSLQDQGGRKLWQITLGNFSFQAGSYSVSNDSSPDVEPSVKRKAPKTAQHKSSKPSKSMHQSQRVDQQMDAQESMRNSQLVSTGPASYYERHEEHESTYVTEHSTSRQGYGPVGATSTAPYDLNDRKPMSAQSPRSLNRENPHNTLHTQLMQARGQKQTSPSERPSDSRRSPSAASADGPSSNPPLIRTSTLNSVTASANFSASPSSSSQPFNPYAMYPNKAFLEIRGDLDAMAEDWSEEEKGAKRRLVEFKRKQNGNTITTVFQPVTIEQRAPNSICVSCIWWEERDEAYVTSVDTIQLLESLVGVRFTVEEKNRIRRNLEGFRPQTVAKGKNDSESFFKTIMDFPNPKPRNIEKDVKVFPWKTLSEALKKIISKYSASYASTASSLHPTSVLEHPTSSSPNKPSRASVSPTSAASSTTSTSQSQNTTPQAASPFALQGSREQNELYARQTSFAPYANTVVTPQQQQYMAYAPIGYSWSPQEAENDIYVQQQQYHGMNAWHYGLDGSPVTASPAQFGPIHSMNLPLQQRQESQVATSQPGYAQYHEPRSRPP